MLELDFFGDIMGLYEQNENGLVTFWGGSPSVDNIKHGQTIVPGRQWAQKARKNAQVVMHFDRKSFMASVCAMCDLLTDEECRKIENILFRKIVERRKDLVYDNRQSKEYSEDNR